MTTVPALAPGSKGLEVTPMADPAKTILTAGPELAPVVREVVVPTVDLAKAILMAVPALALAPAAVEVGVVPMGVLAARTIHTGDLEPVPAPAAGRAAAPMADPAKAPVAGAAGEIPMAGPAKMIRTGDLALVDRAGEIPAGPAGAMTATGTLEINLAARAVEGEVGGREVTTEAMIPMADREIRGGRDKMTPTALEGDLAVDRMIRTAGNSSEETTRAW